MCQLPPASVSHLSCSCAVHHHRRMGASPQGRLATAPAAATPPPPPLPCARSCSSRGQSPPWTPLHTPIPQKTCEAPNICCHHQNFSRPPCLPCCGLTRPCACLRHARPPVHLLWLCCSMKGEGTLGPHTADDSHISHIGCCSRCSRRTSRHTAPPAQRQLVSCSPHHVPILIKSAMSIHRAPCSCHGHCAVVHALEPEVSSQLPQLLAAQAATAGAARRTFQRRRRRPHTLERPPQPPLERGGAARPTRPSPSQRFT